MANHLIKLEQIGDIEMPSPFLRDFGNKKTTPITEWS